MPDARHAPPKDMDVFLMTALRTLRTKRIPPSALRLLIANYEGGRVEFLAGSGVGVVIVDGKLREFVPIQLVVGDHLAKIKMDYNEGSLMRWVKTKMGYVPADSIFIDELRRRSFGEFANPVL